MVSCVRSKKRDSVLGSHSTDFGDFRATADQSCSALKSTKSAKAIPQSEASLENKRQRCKAGARKQVSLEFLES